MAKRFSRLTYAAKTLQSPLGGTDNTPAAGSILDNFLKVRTGVTKLKYARLPASNQGSMVRKGVHPFGITGVDAPGVVRVSNRALALSSLSGIITACKILEGNVTGITRYVGFKPARAIVFVKGTASDTEKTSQITGVKYDPRDGNSYTLPFGKTTATDSYAEIRKAIVTASDATKMQISFKPEDSPVL